MKLKACLIGLIGMCGYGPKATAQAVLYRLQRRVLGNRQTLQIFD